MENSKPTQCERIIRHLRDFGSITSLEAMQEYGIMRLASRMSEIKKNRLLSFTVEEETGKNRYGEKTHYVRYTLAE